jgi:hypothetical protein
MGEQEPLRLVEINWSEGLVAAQALHVETGLLMTQKSVDPQTDRESSLEVMNRIHRDLIIHPYPQTS